MFKTLRYTFICAALAVTSACSGNGGGISGRDLLTKENIGAIGGGAAGAWVGSNVGSGTGTTVATAVGTLLGATLGANIGRSLDSADLAHYDRTSQYAMEETRTGQTTPWNNPDTGAGGTITPTRTYETGGRYCREYTQSINVDGRNVQGNGRACRENDGTWTIVQ